MTELNRLGAAEAARQIATGKITSEALVRDCLERIKARDGEVRAWVYCDPELALAQARAIDKAGAKGPLAGVPVGFKDVIDTCDMPSQYNSPIYRDHRPRTDASCVALVRQAGGVVLGKTVTTEFATRHPGPARNPHNLAHTPGGSSSGSGASVGDFMVPLAFGTQTGGSNIRPAAFCGIVGYKPSFGTINRAGLKMLAESLDTIGVMARTVEDCALLSHAVSARPLPDFAARLEPPRIGFHRTTRWKDMEPANQANLEKAAAALAKAGARVRDFDLPESFDRMYEDQLDIMSYEGARALAHEHSRHRELLSESLRGNLDQGRAMPRERYDTAMRSTQACRHVYQDLFTDVDVLLTASAPGEAPEGIDSTGSPLFNRIWTMLGAPCVTVPFGRGPKGLPLAVQVVGRYDDDERVLLAAEWVRRALA